MAEPGSLAAGLLRTGARRVAHDYPLHAGVLARIRHEPTSETPSVALTVSGFRLALRYSPAYIVTLSLDECAGLLVHVVNHVLFGHTAADPARCDDRRALVIAQEITANEWVRDRLPPGAIVLAQYPKLPPREDTERRYERLRGRVPEPPSAGSAPPGTGGDSPIASPKTLDDHSGWSAMTGIAETVVRAEVARALRELSPGELVRLDPALEDAAHALVAGRSPGQDGQELEVAQAVALPWPVLLRRFLTEIEDPDHSLGYPSRRLPHLVGIVPGKRRLPGRARVMAVIDTSGSMTSRDLSVIAAEFRRLARHADMTVVQCDAEVQDVRRFCGAITRVVGRGGTDFRPPFDARILKRLRPGVVAYFTDGIGPAPEVRPKVPVIWVITPGGEKPAPWGTLARLTNST